VDLPFDRATVKTKTTTAAAANTSHNQKWIYLLTTERHRWQPPGVGPLFIYLKRSSGIITSATAVAGITSNTCNSNYFSMTRDQQ
jgi:hypothetical protein